MKKKKRPVSKKISAPEHVQTRPPAAPPGIPLSERLEQWLGKHRYRVVGGLIVLWIAARVLLLHSVAGGPLYHLYKWKESDSYFFDEWARALAAGDWLNRQPLHPYHGWHQDIAGHYFNQHPDKLNQILAAHPERDTTFVPGKVLWNGWYGGNTYHQEPLYAYMLAILYALTGNGVFWMMLLQGLAGVVSGVLLWWIARRFFNDTAAALTGLLYAFCGIILFQEALILRTAWSVFFALLTVWTFERALALRTKQAFFISGVTIGLAYLLQSYFVLFLIGALVLYFMQERKISKTFLRNTGLVLGGFILVFSPVVLRNAAVGAPLFSSSSIGAATFVATNVQHTTAITRWQPPVAECAEIIGKTEGKFVPAMVEAIGTHSSIGSYVQLLWSKFKSIVNGTEWPNNENYYFYKETVPILKLCFLDFYWIGWIGIAGILFALYYRKKISTLYLAILLQLAIMLGFYVLGRLRTPLAALMLPFAAYALIECLRFAQGNLKASLGKIAVAALCFYLFSYQFYRQRIKMLDPTDYNNLYEIQYMGRIKSDAEAGKMKEAISAHAEFLKYQPGIVTSVRPNQLLQSASDIELVNYFANHYQIHSFLYEDSGHREQAAIEMAKYNMMKQVVENSRRRLRR